LGLGAKGFGQAEQTPVQARIAQVDTFELTNTPASINTLCHSILHQVHDYLARKCTAERCQCHITQHNAFSEDTGNSQVLQVDDWEDSNETIFIETLYTIHGLFP
jgi:hypothetical protein